MQKQPSSTRHRGKSSELTVDERRQILKDLKASALGGNIDAARTLIDRETTASLLSRGFKSLL